MRVAPYSSHSGGAATLVKDRGCFYYVPWIVIMLLLVMGGAVGVWSYFADQARTKTLDGMNALGVSSDSFDRLRPAAIATAVVFLVLLCFVALLSFVHSFVEAALDATGTAGAGTTVFLVFNATQGVLWYVVTVWLIFVLLACTLWAAYLYLLRGSIDSHLKLYSSMPPPNWTPGSGLPCPAQCFDLTYFSFISSKFSSSCTCDQQRLRQAYTEFDDAYHEDMIAVLVGSFVMLVSASLLGINLACQFSHSKRHKEMIHRATSKFYAGYL